MKKISAKIIKTNENIITIEAEELLQEPIENYNVVIEKKTKSRSLDANALSWVLIDRISKSLNLPRDETYKMMLERYGVAAYIVVKPQNAEQIIKSFAHGRVLGDVEVAGKKGTQIQVFLGSSQFDREQFAHYLNGIISECEEMGLVSVEKDVFADALANWR